MTDAFPITIHYNPACSTSRKVLDLVRAAGFEPKVVEYLNEGWTRPQLEALLRSMNARPRDLLREKESAAAELGLLDPEIHDGRLLDAMVRHPALVNRPIVESPKGVRLARPPETVLELLR